MSNRNPVTNIGKVATDFTVRKSISGPVDPFPGVRNLMRQFLQVGLVAFPTEWDRRLFIDSPVRVVVLDGVGDFATEDTFTSTGSRFGHWFRVR